jgi:transposase InsO family protein
MYVKIRGRFFYLIIFIDEYSRYIVHHNLLTSMDANSVSMEVQAAIDRLRKDSIAEPLRQGIMDHHLSPWSSGWCLSRTVSHRSS